MTYRRGSWTLYGNVCAIVLLWNNAKITYELKYKKEKLCWKLKESTVRI